LTAAYPFPIIGLCPGDSRPGPSWTPPVPADTPHVVLLPDAAGVVSCSPDEWVAHAGGLTAAGARQVVLDALPDGSPWDDEASIHDPATDTWAFAPWPGVAFTLPLED
jgi:hypothetical protein